MSCGSKIDLNKLISGGDFRSTIDRLHQDLREGKYTREAIITALLAYIIYLKSQPAPTTSDPDPELYNDLADAEQTLQELAKDGRDMRNAYEAENKRLKEKISELERAGTQRSEIAVNFSQQIFEKQTENKRLQNQITEQKTAIETLERNLVDAKKSNLELETKIAVVNRENERLKTSMLDQGRDNYNKSEEIRELKQKLDSKAEVKSRISPNDYDISNHKDYIEVKNLLRDAEDRLIQAMDHVGKYKEKAETVEKLAHRLADSEITNNYLRSENERMRSEIKKLESEVSKAEDSILKQIQNCREEKEQQKKRITDEYEEQLADAANRLADVKKTIQQMRQQQPATQDTDTDQTAERKRELEEEQSVLESSIRQLNKRERDLKHKIQNLNLEYEKDGKAHRLLHELISNAEVTTETDNKAKLNELYEFIDETYITKKQYLPADIEKYYDEEEEGGFDYNFGFDLRIIVFLIVVLLILIILYEYSLANARTNLSGSYVPANNPEGVGLKQV